MRLFDIVAAILSLTALLAYVNRRLIKLPDTIGVMVLAIAASVGVLIVGNLFPGSVEAICHRVMEIDFAYFVLEVALPFLVFAGALGTDARALVAQRAPVLLFATVGLVLSTAIVGAAMWALLGALGLDAPLLHCLLFGALISPTDPIAVLAILREAGVTPELESDVAGESLLNDGVAVVLFLTLYGLAGGEGHVEFSAVGVLALFAQEVVGGVVLGALLGVIGLHLLRTARSESVDVLITLAVVMGGQATAVALHVSGPLALVVAGLILSAGLERKALDERERKHLKSFWGALDESFNAVLFVLLGLVLLGLADDFEVSYLIAGLLAIPVVLASRLISVVLPIATTSLRCDSPTKTAALLTWGGLRGGISVALALSLATEGMSRELIVHLTYVVVVFSIVVQGLTVGSLVQRLGLGRAGAA